MYFKKPTYFIFLDNFRFTNYWTNFKAAPGLPRLLTSCVNAVHLLQLRNQDPHVLVSKACMLCAPWALTKARCHGSTPTAAHGTASPHQASMFELLIPALCRLSRRSDSWNPIVGFQFLDGNPYLNSTHVRFFRVFCHRITPHGMNVPSPTRLSRFQVWQLWTELLKRQGQTLVQT